MFVGYDENGVARQAFQRGTIAGVSFKGEVPGSNKSYCFAIEGRNENLMVYEAAIDAISHASILKHFGMSWKKDHRIALGCLSDRALEGYLKRHLEIKNITFALDNDWDAKYSNGDPALNWGQLAAEKLAEKYSKLGYSTNIEKPMAKDWNEDLMNLHLAEQLVSEKNNEISTTEASSQQEDELDAAI